MRYLILILLIFTSHCLGQTKTMDIEDWILDDSNELKELHNTVLGRDVQPNPSAFARLWRVWAISSLLFYLFLCKQRQARGLMIPILVGCEREQS